MTSSIDNKDKQNKEKVQSNKKSIMVTITLIYLAVVAALYIYAYVIPDITGALTKTYIVQSDTFTTKMHASCVVVRDEIVYNAEYNGSTNYYVEESEKTRINTRVVDIYSSDQSKHSLYCKKTGFVSYYSDGYEGLLTPATIIDMEPSSYLSIGESTESKKTSSVVKGDFLYKLVDGSAWYLMIPVEEGNLSKFRAGSKLNIALADGTSFSASVYKILGESSFAVMAKVTSYYPDFAKYRVLDVDIITKETYGLVVPKTAVVNNDAGKAGVYVLGTDGEYHFTRILILEEDGDNILIQESEFTETLEDGTTKGILSVDLYDEIKRDAND